MNLQDGFAVIDTITYVTVAVLIAGLGAYVVYQKIVVPRVFPRLCLADSRAMCAMLTFQSKDNAALLTVKEQDMTVFFNGRHAFMYPQPSETSLTCEQKEVLAYRVNRITGELMYHECAPSIETVQAMFSGQAKRSLAYPLRRRLQGLGYLTAGDALRVLEEYNVVNRYNTA